MEMVMPVFRDLELIYYGTYHKSHLTVIQLGSMDFVTKGAETLCKTS